MSDIIGTLVKRSELAGDLKVHTVQVNLESADDTIDVSAITGEVVAILGSNIEGGQDANFQSIGCVKANQEIVVTSFGADGAVATDWTGALITVSFLGT